MQEIANWAALPTSLYEINKNHYFALNLGGDASEDFKAEG
jgi:hypothetical protein